MHTICPWCDAEIVWDEEIGEEESCPYCENELGNYRSVPVALQPDQEIEEPQSATSSHDDLQEDWVYCKQCDQSMVLVGHQQIEQHAFQARLWKGKPLLSTPFTIDLYLCPSCDRLDQVLSLNDKEQFLRTVDPS